MSTFAVVMVTQGHRDTQAAAEASVRAHLPAGAMAIEWMVSKEKTQVEIWTP